ncbi:MAG: hypothetical protein IKT58_01525 [Oscillospiraceae bacterium]|nr:hypothetical protein [Oscillospiraceae bacterium]
MKSYLSKKILGIVLLFLPLYMVGGYIFRNYQLQHELRLDGSLVPGAFMHKILLLMAASLVLAFLCISLFIKPMKTFRDCFSTHPVSCGAQILAGVGLFLGNAMNLGNEAVYDPAYSQVSVMLTNSMPYWGMLGGVCIILFALAIFRGQKPSPLLYMEVSIYLAIRLIVHFQAWNTDPSVHDYAYTLISAICTMLASFQLAGFCFDKGARRITVFWCVCAVFFGSVSAPDAMGKTASLLIQLSQVLLMAVMTLELVFVKDSPEESPAELPENTPQAGCP